MKIIKTYKELTESLNKEDQVEISVDDKVQWCIDYLYSWYSYKILDSDELSEITSDHGTMHIKGSHLPHFPVKFANIDGSFKVNSCKNIDLVGSPDEVGDDYILWDLPYVETLNGISKNIGGELFINNCPNLKSLDGLPLDFPEERIRLVAYSRERANELIYNWKNGITPDELENFKSDWEI
jgi:hypothetical protein